MSYPYGSVENVSQAKGHNGDCVQDDWQEWPWPQGQHMFLPILRVCIDAKARFPSGNQEYFCFLVKEFPLWRYSRRELWVWMSETPIRVRIQA